MCADFFMCVFNNLACFAGGFELGAVDADLILRYNKTAGSWVFPLFCAAFFQENAVWQFYSHLYRIALSFLFYQTCFHF